MKISVHHSIAIVGLALLLVMPAILSPQMIHDSFGIDWVWADQFTRELSQGNPYPRWLPLSHGGLGSPVFYYYPPLAFYMSGSFGLIGFSTYASIIATFFAGFVASGFAMYAWLKESAKSPLLGAFLYMAAPYHVLDFYSRGAIAEFMAIIFIPLVALGLQRAAEGRLVLGAFAYAGLILSHLPLALLTSLFFLAPYGLCSSRLEPRRLFHIAISFSIGLAMASIYVVPAIALAPYRDSALLWKFAIFQPETWTFLRWGLVAPSDALKLLMGLVIFSLLQPVVVLLFSAQRSWGIFASFCCAMAAALVPALWQVPLLQTVQFPYRILPLAEFAIATGIARVALPRAVLLAACLPVFALSTYFALGEPIRTAPDMPRHLIAQYGDVPENLPPGERPPNWPSHWALSLARSHPAPVQVDEKTIDNVFFFPAWEVQCQGRSVPTAPEAKTKLLTYQGSDCSRRLIWTTAERVGAAISLAGLLCMLGLAGFRRSRARRSHVDNAVLV